MDLGLIGKLGYQAISTSTYSIGQNWIHDRPLFSNVTVGVGPINLTLRNGKLRYRASENLGNLIAHGIGFLNVAAGGRVTPHYSDLAFEFSGGLLDKLPDDLSGWTGAYAILGKNPTSGSETTHELSHVWQSRAFHNTFIQLWALSGLYSILNGYNFNDFINSKTINFIELGAGIE